jgi:hypothetical protein
MRSNYATSYGCPCFLSSPLTGEDQGGGEKEQIRHFPPILTFPRKGGRNPRATRANPLRTSCAVYLVGKQVYRPTLSAAQKRV